MKILILLTIIVGCVPCTLGMAQTNLPIAVLDFENRSGHGGAKYGQQAAEWLTSELSQKGLNLVERKRLDALVQEQAFQSSGQVDPQKAVSIGKMLGAEVIVVGTISKLGVGKNTVRVADSTITRYNAVAEVGLRAINVQTGAVVFSGTEQASTQAKSASVPDFDMGNKAPAVDGPLKKAIQTLALKLEQKIKPAPRPKSKISIL